MPQILSELPAQATHQTLLTRVKNHYISSARAPRKIATGPFRGIVMNLSLRTQTQLYLGLYERETFRWIKRLSRSLATAIDIGVAEGEFTLFFLARTNAKKVWAFEPDPDVLPLFRENLRLNSLANTERLEFRHEFVGDSGNRDEMPLDSLATTIQSPCLIKVDAEGAEGRILRGARTLNKLPEIRWLIETHSKKLEAECIQLLADSGFHTRIIPQASWRVILPDYRPLEQNRWLAAWKQ
jgi:hypothetical protein